MDWKFLIIPLVALGIWIIWNIFRAAEDQKEQERLREQRRQRAAERQAAAPPPRKQVNDLDRFLSDARSRRSGSRANRDAPVKVLREQPAPPPAPPPSRAEELPRAIPVAPKPTPRADSRPVPTMKQPAFVPLPAAPAPPPEPVPTRASDLPTVEPARVAQQAATPLMLRLRAMMRDRESLKAAMALQEILDRPLSQRRR